MLGVARAAWASFGAWSLSCPWRVLGGRERNRAPLRVGSTRTERTGAGSPAGGREPGCELVRDRAAGTTGPDTSAVAQLNFRPEGPALLKDLRTRDRAGHTAVPPWTAGALKLYAAGVFQALEISSTYDCQAASRIFWAPAASVVPPWAARRATPSCACPVALLQGAADGSFGHLVVAFTELDRGQKFNGLRRRSPLRSRSDTAHS
jgi:hypothetical protein